MLGAGSTSCDSDRVAARPAGMAGRGGGQSCLTRTSSGFGVVR